MYMVTPGTLPCQNPTAGIQPLRPFRPRLVFDSIGKRSRNFKTLRHDLFKFLLLVVRKIYVFLDGTCCKHTRPMLKVVFTRPWHGLPGSPHSHVACPPAPCWYGPNTSALIWSGTAEEVHLRSCKQVLRSIFAGHPEQFLTCLTPLQGCLHHICLHCTRLLPVLTPILGPTRAVR